MKGIVAPRDPEKRRSSFYIMYHKNIAGSIQPNGLGVQFIYLNDGRMINSAKIVGNITDAILLEKLQTTKGFREVVHSIGIVIEAEDRAEQVNFIFQMYGHQDTYGSGTQLRMPIIANGMEHILNLKQWDWSDDDNIPGQIRFEFGQPNQLAKVSVRFYLNDGYTAPELEVEAPIDFTSKNYQKMIDKSLVQLGNWNRLKKAIDKAKRREEVTIAFIGGSITQGAGAIPIHKQCYAYKAFQGFCKVVGCKEDENVHFCKAGVGGTPSELGMIRYERDICREGAILPDVVIVEFAVNDEGDETKGTCFESLVRKILNAPNEPAVILLFSVFANDENLQERLMPIGVSYQLPMVSVKDAVVEQFYQSYEAGKVISKSQYFYDIFHPSNDGHTIMADGLYHLFYKVNSMNYRGSNVNVLECESIYGYDFEQVKLLDRITNPVNAQILPGSFCEIDTELQCVEQDMNLTPTPEFPNNWMNNGNEPFQMDIVCSTLFIVYKDSASNEVGTANVYVDGEVMLEIDPHKIGWTHCNPLICFRNHEKRNHHIKICMKPGDENKRFTILGFGYVE